MSRFTGAKCRGAMRDLRSVRRAEAEDRQAAFDAEVAKTAGDQNCELETARDIVLGRRRFEIRRALKAAAR